MNQENTFAQLADTVKRRRTIKPLLMNGKTIPDEQINQILELAHWAPTHGRTEPWQFFVYKGDMLKRFGQVHGELYWQHTAETERDPAKREKLETAIDTVSHLVIAVMRRGRNPKIPFLEEVAAAAAAIQNVLLGATALGIASMWNSGGMTHHEALKEHLQLEAEDMVMGLLYLGYTDEEPKEGKRFSGYEEKVVWME